METSDHRQEINNLNYVITLSNDKNKQKSYKAERQRTNVEIHVKYK